MQIKVELVNIDTLKFHAALIAIPPYTAGDHPDSAGDGGARTRLASRTPDALAAATPTTMYGLST